MVEIAPFRGVTYNFNELSQDGPFLTAPPYDVLSEAERQAYHQKNAHNILHIDLGPVYGNDPEKYTWHQRSAALLTKWLSEGTLVRNPKPAIYHLATKSYDLETGQEVLRHGFVALMRLEEFSPNSMVRPHEKTFSSHKEERLSLMKATKGQISQVFCFFPDPASEALSLIKMTETPQFNFTDQQNLTHSLWINEDPEKIAALQKVLSAQKAYIADGHHRYETALNYRRYLAEKNELTPDHPANFVMVYFSPDSDEGLYALPTHRLLGDTGKTKDELLNLLKDYFYIKEFKSNGQTEEAVKTEFFQELAKAKKDISFGFYLHGEESYNLLSLKEEVKQTIVSSGVPKALAQIDTYVLANVAFQKAFNFSEKDMDNPDLISYVAKSGTALEMVKKGEKKAVFFLNSCTTDEIIAVAEVNQVMPRKSTYFYPKVTTGLVLNIF